MTHVPLIIWGWLVPGAMRSNSFLWDPTGSLCIVSLDDGCPGAIYILHTDKKEMPNMNQDGAGCDNEPELGMNPLIVFISILFGGWVWGVPEYSSPSPFLSS